MCIFYQSNLDEVYRLQLVLVMNIQSASLTDKKSKKTQNTPTEKKNSGRREKVKLVTAARGFSDKGTAGSHRPHYSIYGGPGTHKCCFGILSNKFIFMLRNQLLKPSNVLDNCVNKRETREGN